MAASVAKVTATLRAAFETSNNWFAGTLGGERISTLAKKFPKDETTRKKQRQRLENRVRRQMFKMAWAEVTKTTILEPTARALFLSNGITIQAHGTREGRERRDNETRDNSEGSGADSHARPDSPTLGALSPIMRALQGSDETTLIGGTSRIASPQMRTGPTKAVPSVDENSDNEQVLADPHIARLEMFECIYEQGMEALSKRLSETLEAKNKAKEEMQKARVAKKAEIRAHFDEGRPSTLRLLIRTYLGHACWWICCCGCCNPCFCCSFCRAEESEASAADDDIELGNLDNIPKTSEGVPGQLGENVANPPLDPEAAQAENQAVRPLLPQSQESATTLVADRTVAEAYPQVPARGRLSGAVSSPFGMIGAVGRQHLCPKRGSWWNVFRRSQRSSRGSRASGSQDRAERGESAAASSDEEVAEDDRIPEVIVRQNG